MTNKDWSETTPLNELPIEVLSDFRAGLAALK